MLIFIYSQLHVTALTSTLWCVPRGKSTARSSEKSEILSVAVNWNAVVVRGGLAVYEAPPEFPADWRRRPHISAHACHTCVRSHPNIDIRSGLFPVWTSRCHGRMRWKPKGQNGLTPTPPPPPRLIWVHFWNFELETDTARISEGFFF